MKKKSKSEKLTFLDVYCGAGGFTLGFVLAGFKPVAAIDKDRMACNTHSVNFARRGCHTLVRDLNRYGPKRLHSYLRRRRISTRFDVIIGGPPCQGWSVVGRGKLKSLLDGNERIKDDPRNKLYRRFVNFVRYFRPKCFVMENVPGMLQHNGVNVADAVKRELEACGYRVEYKVINAAEHGVPQVRRRLFFVGFRDNLRIEVHDFFDSLVKRSGPTVRCAIGDLPRVGHAQLATPVSYKAKLGRPNWFVRYVRGRSNGEVRDHITRGHNHQDLRAFAYMKQGMTYSELPKRFKRYSDEIFKDKYKKLYWDRHAWTLTAHLRADCYSHIHPSQRRTISVREAARLQSFPDWFKLSGSLGGKFQLIGNAVPPLLAKEIAVGVKKRISRCRSNRKS